MTETSSFPTGAQAIGQQPTLPLHVAWGVVTQGIRIRLGRSLVTLTSVALGIAFLASILVGQVVQQGVQEETNTRDETLRQIAALEADIGKLSGKKIVVFGEPTATEQRLLTGLTSGGALLAVATDATEGHPSQDPPAATLRCGGAAIPATISGIIAGSFPISENGPSVFATAERRIINFSLAASAEEQAARANKAYRATARAGWITGIALAVTAIGITNAMLMSVTERFREIGTMKCLGALGSFIRRVFVLEACFIGTVGGLAGSLLGCGASLISYSIRYGGGLVLHSTAWGMVTLLLIAAVLASIVLSIISAMYPAWVAARMLPANALRSSV